MDSDALCVWKRDHHGSYQFSQPYTVVSHGTLQGVYNGSAIASSKPCGGKWTRLEAVVNMSRSAALQLRMTAPTTDQNWGGAVWVGATSIVAES